MSTELVEAIISKAQSIVDEGWAGDESGDQLIYELDNLLIDLSIYRAADKSLKKYLDGEAK